MNDPSPRPRIACVHLFDDFSGSAKVFAHALTVLAAQAQLRIIVGSAGESGFIRAAHPVETVFYRFRENRLLLLFYFALAQALLFFKVLRICLLWRAEIVYVNTVLPAGAVLAGRLCGRKVVVHVHEVGLGSRALFRVVFGVARRAAHRLVCVSNYVRESLRLPVAAAPVVHNSLAEEEWQRAENIAATRNDDASRRFLVLMACSLKWYKGIDSFVALAQRSPNLRFRLLLNCEAAEWRAFTAQMAIPPNLEVVMRPPDVYAHYAEARLVLNLSHPEGWVETFGMTLLEAMACGIPVVCPTVGGCVELFDEGHGGWRLDSRNLDAIGAIIERLATDAAYWRTHSDAARSQARRFEPRAFAAALRAAVLSPR